MPAHTVTITLAAADAIVLDSCIERLFGQGDMHDWEDASLKFERETEQYPFFQLRDQLVDQLHDELTSADYVAIFENAHQSINAREWGK